MLLITSLPAEEVEEDESYYRVGRGPGQGLGGPVPSMHYSHYNCDRQTAGYKRHKRIASEH